MKNCCSKILMAGAMMGAVFCADAAYQVYDVQLKVKTMKPVTIVLPCFLQDLAFGPSFRMKVTENIKGYLVCNGPYRLDSPDLIYLKNTSTGDAFYSSVGYGSSMWLGWYWDIYDRLSPQDKSVEIMFQFLFGDYNLTCAGEGKIKTAKYKKVFSRGTKAVTIADGLKGELVGYKQLYQNYGVSMDGMDTWGSDRCVAHGTWKIKYNKRLSDALYRFSAFPYGGAISCLSDDSSSDAEEDSSDVSVADIQKLLGL